MVDYGQLVIGPPGSGKSTYCEGMHQLMSTLGREHLTINLDFANDWNSRNDYNLSKGNKDVILFDPPDVDVRNLITIDRVMKEKNLGPNGALLYCNSYLAKNMQWLKTKIKDAKHKKQTQHAYLLIDMPGQVELYTVDDSIKTILAELSNRDRDARLCAVHLIDSTLCVQPHQYLSALMIALSAQITLEMPFINVFSKVDLIEEDNLNFSLEYFARAEDLDYLIPEAHPSLHGGVTKFSAKEETFAKLHKAICELVEEYSLVSLIPLNIQNKESAVHVLAMADKANGFALSAYTPPALRVPGSEEAGDELRLPVDQARFTFAHKWFT